MYLVHEISMGVSPGLNETWKVSFMLVSATGDENEREG